MNSYQDNIRPEAKLRDLKFDWNGKGVIDMGCNIGLVGEYVFERGASDYVGIDYKPEFIKEGKRRNPKFKLYVADVLEYSNYKTDVMVCLGLFHHLTNEQVEKLVKNCDCEYLIFEVPVGEADEKRFRVRPREYYKNLIYDFGDIIGVVKSGLKPSEDYPYERIIYVVQKLYPLPYPTKRAKTRDI